MKIILANGAELEPILVTGGKRMVQGVNRDTLRFVFPAEAGMAELDAAFTPDACCRITVEDGSGSYVHTGYTIRSTLEKEQVEVQPATAEEPAVCADRITVAMSQRTWMETQLLSLTETVDALVMESLLKEV